MRRGTPPKTQGPTTDRLMRRTKEQVPTPDPKRRHRTKPEEGMPITAQQKQFVAEYLKDYDIQAAAKRVGFKGNSHTIQKMFLSLGPFIQEAQLAKARAIGERSFTSQERVLEELAADAHYSEMDFVVIEQVANPAKPGEKMTVRRQKRLEELTVQQQGIIKNIQFMADGNATYSLPNRMMARMAIGKHLGMFNDKMILEHRNRQLLGRPNLSTVPDGVLDKMEADLLKYMGPKGLRLIGEYQERDENEFDATQSQ